MARYTICRQEDTRCAKPIKSQRCLGSFSSLFFFSFSIFTQKPIAERIFLVFGLPRYLIRFMPSILLNLSFGWFSISCVCAQCSVQSVHTPDTEAEPELFLKNVKSLKWRAPRWQKEVVASAAHHQHYRHERKKLGFRLAYGCTAYEYRATYYTYAQCRLDL